MSLIVTAIDGQGSYSSSDGATVTSAGVGADALYSFTTDFLAVDGVVQASDSFEIIEDSPKGLSVRVRVGTAYVLNDNWSTSSQAPKYFRVDNTAVETLSVDSNGSGNPRIDVVSLVVNTAASPNDDASNVASFTVSKGTPAASPSAPTSPANSLELARFTVSNGASQVSSSDIIDLRIRPYLQNDVFDEPVLANDKALKGEDTSGNALDLIKVGTSDEVEIGNSNPNTFAGIINNPAQYRTLLSKSGSQSIPNASFTRLTFGTGSEVVDVGDMHSTSVNTSRITIPADGAGIYHVYASVIWAASASGNRRIVGILVNGSAANPAVRQDQGPVGSGITVVNVSGFVAVSGGDYIEINAYQDSGGALNVDTGTAFGVAKIS